MAMTKVNSGDPGVQQIWDEEIFRDIQIASYFDKMKSSDGSKVIHEKMDLTKKAGETINFTMMYREDGSFLTSGTPIEGNEEDFTTSAESIAVAEYNFGMRFKNGIDAQRPVYDVDSETRRALIQRAAERIDKKFFNALRATNTDVYYLVSGVFTNTPTLATATAAVTSSDLITPASITNLVAVNKVDRANGRIPITPMMIEGKPHLVLLAHPYQIADLKKDPTYHQARLYAEARGKDNPIFSGAVGVWDGVIIHEHENVYKAANASSVYYAQAYLLGQQAILCAIAKKPEIIKQQFSYEQQTGYGYKSIWECLKPQFTKPGETSAKDFGSLCLVTALTNLK